MNTAKITSALFVLLLGALVALFFLYVSIIRDQKLAVWRIEQLESRPPSVIEKVESTARENEQMVVAQDLPLIVTTPAPTSTARPSAAPTVTPRKTITDFALFGAGFTTSSLTWTDVTGSDIELNKGEFGASPDIVWSAMLRVEAGSGEVRARLFDVTNSVVVSGSEISNTQGTSALTTSGKLNMFSGKNVYRVQIMSKLNNPVFFDGGRIKVSYATF